MIRTKVILLYILMISVLTGVALLLVQTGMSSALRTDAESALKRSANLAEQAARMDEASLLAKAAVVASSQNVHDAMLDKVEVPDGESYTFEERRHLGVHQTLLERHIVLEDIAKEANGRRNLELEPLARKPHELDIFMALDAKGVGVAALGKDLYSWFGSDVSKQFPAVKKLGLGVGRPQVHYWMWSFSAANEKRLYRVAVAPIRPSSSEAGQGVVVLGAMLNDGMASVNRKTFAGLSESDESELDGLPHVVYLRGKGIVGSTFSSDSQPAIAAALQGFQAESDVVSEVVVGEVPYLTTVRPIGGEGDGAIRVAVMQPLPAVMKPLTEMQANIIFVGLAILLLGIGLIFFVIISWERPIERIETGIQEVIAGNRDYTWEAVEGHGLASSFAQSLNLMSAFLQGKPMPDDDGADTSWDSMSDLNQPAPTGEKPKIQGVALPMMQSLPKDKDPEES